MMAAVLENKHRRLLEEIEREAKYTASYTGKNKFDHRVMDAMAKVIRTNFVPEQYIPLAYNNGPLPIGYGQTISQPYIVALMTDLLQLTTESIVLEVGTGSGYQAAVISLLAKKVYTLERIEALADSARARLKKLRYNNIEVRCKDGYLGWHEKGPFDSIIVTAAIDHIPPALVAQLKSGGRMVLPVGLPNMHQELLLITKDNMGEVDTQYLLDVAFVPLITDKTHAKTEL